MTPTQFGGFLPSLFRFQEQLQRNNNRQWFQTNKQRYETEVREPCLRFIRAFASRLEKISPFFVASDSRVGGSLMRIYRDTRFSKDKTPYKTNVGIHFRHELCDDVHAPGFYVHLAPDECYLGVGVWHPDSAALAKIRETIAREPAKWKRARDNKQFRAWFELTGDRLKTAPRGVDKDHPLIEDLKRKDFLGLHSLRETDVVNANFAATVAAAFTASRPYVRFLCQTLQVPF